ncbi:MULTISPECIES: class I SAM-dependent methyltransferase [Campylobacter]|uniref:Class I SAM-dependent methyltransferase n=1 Tax=Campylobacter porcelli TaxID=1660073 RepID=A0ABU7M370_9BACT|nr:class I SAM-dependent methyltransferase [Campylobacter sp. P0024]MCR8678276.1 class I SAM-dependent methyltransferase [Campylobacter sp. RM19072]MEE3744019.1 class I SAM-dependent methyltransferase [Campylobacter sp. CX2-4855-23]MEE3776276.1 class I SAM-dependent methyltransferase [Campylobacter sp. CX2-4080-23]
MINSVNDYKEHFELWEDLVLSGDRIYPSEFVVRFAFKNKFKSVLDFGCANGRHLECFSKAGATKLIGVDLNQKPLDLAKSRLEHIINSRGGTLELYSNKNRDINEILKDIKVDAIVAWEIAYLYTPNIALNLLKSLKSHLNPNGKILINFISTDDSLKSDAKLIGENLYEITEHTHKGLIFTFYNLDMIKELMQKAGLKILAIEKNHYWLDGGAIKHDYINIQATHDR